MSRLAIVVVLFLSALVLQACPSKSEEAAPEAASEAVEFEAAKEAAPEAGEAEPAAAPDGEAGGAVEGGEEKEEAPENVIEADDAPAEAPKPTSGKQKRKRTAPAKTSSKKRGSSLPQKLGESLDEDDTASEPKLDDNLDLVPPKSPSADPARSGTTTPQPRAMEQPTPD